MNNATRQDSVHPCTVPSQDNDQDDPESLTGDQSFSPAEQKEISEVLQQLDEIRYTPHPSGIRAVLKYAREKNKAVH